MVDFIDLLLWAQTHKLLILTIYSTTNAHKNCQGYAFSKEEERKEDFFQLTAARETEHHKDFKLFEDLEENLGKKKLIWMEFLS
jgi:hypothetical protein